MSIPLAQYLFTRLGQLNCHSVHGVPGDFTLRALDYLPKAGLKWIGNANELCSGYAADGYARAAAMARRTRSRVPRVGCCFTTYGVGELSGINALAGAYAESSPLVWVVGTPTRKQWRTRPSPIMHHTLGDGGSLGVYAELAKVFTCAQADLVCDDPDEAAARIDRALAECVKQSKPAYINMPCDMATREVSSSPLSESLKLDSPETDPVVEDDLVCLIYNRLQTAKRPLIIADGLSYPWDFIEEVNELVRITGIPSTCFIAGKGVVDESTPAWIGPLSGPTEYSNSTDLCLLFGPLLSDTNTAGWSAIPDLGVTVAFNLDSVNVGGMVHRVQSKALLKQLVKRLQASSSPAKGKPANPGKATSAFAQPPADHPIEQDALWTRMSKWVQPHDTLLLANGTPLIGGRAMSLPSPVQVVASGIWTSIGSMLPAAQGIAAAKRDCGIPGRTVILEGDGSFQVTCQSISDILRYRLDVTIFIANNAGYTYERWLNGMTAEYNDVPGWNYVDAGRFFGGIQDDPSYPCVTRKVRTWDELEDVLSNEAFSDGRGLKLVDVALARDGVPEITKAGLRRASSALREM